MKKDMSPWTLKYLPQSKKELIGLEQASQQVEDFITNFKKQKKKGIILYGPTGSGKTSLAYAVAKDNNLEVIEANASDVRNKQQILEKIGPAMKQMSLFAQGKIILFDEIDGLSGTKDRGGASAIAELIQESAFPVIMTAEDPYNKKFSALRKQASLIELEELGYDAILTKLVDIAKKEKIECDEYVLKSIARQVGGDMRAAINDLQMLSSSGNKITKEDLDVIEQRRKSEDIENGLMKVFKTTDPLVALHAFDTVDEDYDKVMLWIDENLPYEYSKPEDLSRAYHWLSRADVFSGRIRRWQQWRFIVYIYHSITAGVALSKDEKYKTAPEYKETKRLLKIWMANQRNLKKKAIGEKIAKKTHTSIRSASNDDVPFIAQIIKKSPQHAQAIGEYLELDNDEIAWLKK